MKINYEYIEEVFGTLESPADYREVQSHLNREIDIKVEGQKIISEGGRWIATIKEEAIEK